MAKLRSSKPASKLDIVKLLRKISNLGAQIKSEHPHKAYEELEERMKRARVR